MALSLPPGDRAINQSASPARNRTHVRAIPAIVITTVRGRGHTVSTETDTTATAGTDETLEGGQGTPDTKAHAWWSLATTRNKVIAGAIALVLAVGGTGIGMAVADHNARQSAEAAYSRELSTQQLASETSRTQAQSDYDGAAALVDEALASAQAVLDGSSGQVADDTVRTSLQDAITAAASQRALEVTFTEETVTVAPSEVIEGDDRFPSAELVLTTGTTPSVSDLETSITTVNEAAAAVTLAQSEWTFESLNTATANARDVVLAGSAGKVADDSVRVALQGAIDAAMGSLGAGVGATPNADLIAQRDAITSASQAVTDAQSAWQTAEDERVRAEQALAAQNEAAAPASSTRNNNASTPSGTRNGSGASASGNSPAQGSAHSGAAGNSSGSGSTGAGAPATTPTVPTAPAKVSIDEWGGVAYSADKCSQSGGGGGDSLAGSRASAAGWGSYTAWHITGTQPGWLNFTVYGCLK